MNERLKLGFLKFHQRSLMEVVRDTCSRTVTRFWEISGLRSKNLEDASSFRLLWVLRPYTVSSSNKKVKHKFYLYETIYGGKYQINNYLFSKVYKKGIQQELFFFKVLNFLLANEFMRATFFLNLRKFISKNKMVINLWVGVNLISWKRYCFWTFYKQNICNNGLAHKIRLSILHSFIVIYTNYSSHLVQMFKVQHFYLKCYNVYKQKWQQNEKKVPYSFRKLQSSRVSFDFLAKVM